MQALRALADRWDHLFQQRLDADRYRVRVVSVPAMYFDRSRVPFELRFAIDHCDDGIRIAKGFLERGLGIAILRAPRTRKEVLDSAVFISKQVEQGVMEPWLSDLIFQSTIPVFTDDDILDAQEQGASLYTHAQQILDARGEMIKLVLVDLDRKGIADEDLKELEKLNRAIYPLSAAYLHHRILSDRRMIKIRFISVFARMFFVIGPFAHILNLWVNGIGILFASLADDLSRKLSDLILLKQAGYTSRQLWNAARIYLPILIFDIWLAFQVMAYVANEWYALAGFFFGIIAITFPLVQSLVSFIDLRLVFADLLKNGKLSIQALSPSRLAWDELRRDRVWTGLWIGMLIAPFCTAFAFALAPSLIANGWFLSIFAITDVLLALTFSLLMIVFDRLRFIYQIKRRMGR